MIMRRLQDLDLLALLLALTVAALGIAGAQAQIYTDIHDFDTPLLASPQYSGILAQGRDGNQRWASPQIPVFHKHLSMEALHVQYLAR